MEVALEKQKFMLNLIKIMMNNFFRLKKVWIFLLLFLAPHSYSMIIVDISDVWMFEVACHNSQVVLYNAGGSLLARAEDGRLMSANGSLEGVIRECQNISSSNGSLLARRDNEGHYYLANGSPLGRVDKDGRFYSANGGFVMRLATDSLYNSSGGLMARFRVGQ